jgi:hypothetical protein
VIDEAGSEFGVKGEYAKSKIPLIETQMAEIEKLMAACAGKDPEKDKPQFEALKIAYEEFAQNVELLQGYWGHRVDAVTGGNA